MSMNFDMDSSNEELLEVLYNSYVFEHLNSSHRSLTIFSITFSFVFSLHHPRK